MPRPGTIDFNDSGLDQVIGAPRDHFGDRLAAGFSMCKQHSHGEGLPLVATHRILVVAPR